MAAKCEQYKELFKQADVNGDGFLTVQELREILKKGGGRMSDKEVAETFIYFDGPRGDRRITFQEFCKGLDNIVDYMNKVEALFKELDTSGDGYLDKNELKVLLSKTGKKYTDAEVNTILKDADVNNDNRISFQEFIQACTHV